MSHDQIDKDWFAATLTDAYESLGEAVELLDNGDLEDAEDVLKNKLLHVYAKLNYAVNTAYLGASALETMDEDALIAWPEEMPFTYEPDEMDDEGDGSEEDDGSHQPN